MSLVLDVDAAPWRRHLRSYVTGRPTVVPVVKGNGYGFGRHRLLAEAAALGLDTVAVGTYAEAAEMLGRHPFRTVAVLAPWRPSHPAAAGATSEPTLLHTVSRVEDVGAIAIRAHEQPIRVAVELLTSMRRHGIAVEDLPALAASLSRVDGVHVEAAAFHLPIHRPYGTDHVGEVERWLERLDAAGLSMPTVFTSHLAETEMARLAAVFPGVSFRPRVGSALWLGAPSAVRARAEVIDVHPLRLGERFGYWQRRGHGNGTLVIVAGGTSHGIGLDTPVAPRGLARGRVLASAGLDALGLRLSPYHWRGSQRWYAEPPHMQVSMLFLPATVVPPSVGDWLEVDCRKTTTTFDEVQLR